LSGQHAFLRKIRVLRNGVTKRRCQRSGCNEYAYVKIGINLKVILCADCRTSEWVNESVKETPRV